MVVFACSASDVALLVSAFGGSLAAVIAAVASAIGVIRAGRIRDEVRTWNESTLGELGEEGETRRILLIPAGDRSEKEVRHIVESDERE